jgi:hypothetical protein
MTKLSEAESAAADAMIAKAGLTRSGWLRDLVLAAGQVPAPSSPARTGRLRATGDPPVTGAAKPRRCPHPGLARSAGGWCDPCGVKVLPGGLLPD